MDLDRLDAPLLAATDDAFARPLAPAIIRARSDVLAGAAALATIPTARLAGEWPWRDGPGELAFPSKPAPIVHAVPRPRQRATGCTISAGTTRGARQVALELATGDPRAATRDGSRSARQIWDQNAALYAAGSVAGA